MRLESKEKPFEYVAKAPHVYLIGQTPQSQKHWKMIKKVFFFE